MQTNKRISFYDMEIFAAAKGAVCVAHLLRCICR